MDGLKDMAILGLPMAAFGVRAVTDYLREIQENANEDNPDLALSTSGTEVDAPAFSGGERTISESSEEKSDGIVETFYRNGVEDIAVSRENGIKDIAVSSGNGIDDTDFHGADLKGISDSRSIGLEAIRNQSGNVGLIVTDYIENEKNNVGLPVIEEIGERKIPQVSGWEWNDLLIIPSSKQQVLQRAVLT